MKNLVKMCLFLALLSTWMAVPSCTPSQCLQEANRNTIACVVEHDVVDCTKNTIVSAEFLPLILTIVDTITEADGTVDWSKLEARLESLGIRDGGCILAELQNDLFSKKSVDLKSAKKAATYQDGFATFRQKKWPGVKFKVRGADGKEVVL